MGVREVKRPLSVAQIGEELRQGRRVGFVFNGIVYIALRIEKGKVIAAPRVPVREFTNAELKDCERSS